jgi:hypothetical protein
MFKLKRVWLLVYRGNWITWTTSDKIVTMLINVNLFNHLTIRSFTWLISIIILTNGKKYIFLFFFKYSGIYYISLTLWVRIPFSRDVLDTTLCDKVCQWLAAGRWFSPGTLISSTNKTDSHDIIEILLKVALNTITISFH